MYFSWDVKRLISLTKRVNAKIKLIGVWKIVNTFEQNLLFSDSRKRTFISESFD